MNKGELTRTLAERANISGEEARTIVETFFRSMKETLKEGGGASRYEDWARSR